MLPEKNGYTLPVGKFPIVIFKSSFSVGENSFNNLDHFTVLICKVGFPFPVKMQMYNFLNSFFKLIGNSLVLSCEQYGFQVSNIVWKNMDLPHRISIEISTETHRKTYNHGGRTRCS